MPLPTTCIGAYPKPAFLPKFDWFEAEAGSNTARRTDRYKDAIAELGAEAEALFSRAAREVIADQVEAGIDVVTDGEVRRENYIHYHCRHLEGFDFANPVEKDAREGAFRVYMPCIRGAVAAGEPFLSHDWRSAQSFSDRPVKMTIPGPLTIGDTVADAYYGDPRARGEALAAAINREVLALAEAGCRHIQIDEPVFARRVAQALAFGFEHLERCFHGAPESIVRTLHLCCGYPNRLDDEDYPKAPRSAYVELAEAIERSSVHAVSIEDAHRPNDLSLLERFESTTVVLGVIAIAKSRVEPVEEILARLRAALDHIDTACLQVAPDCGLGFLSRDTARAKLANMCEAARLAAPPRTR